MRIGGVIEEIGSANVFTSKIGMVGVKIVENGSMSSSMTPRKGLS